MIKKSKIKKGDTVIIVSGKERVHQKKGEVLNIDLKKDRVLVNNVNLVKKHKKSQNQENKKPQVVEEPAPLHISNVMFFCSKCDKGVRLGFKTDDKGSKTRFCKKCGTTVK